MKAEERGSSLCTGSNGEGEEIGAGTVVTGPDCGSKAMVTGVVTAVEAAEVVEESMKELQVGFG